MAQMILFGQLEFFELYRTILVSSCGLEKVTTVVAFLFMKRRLIMVPIWRQQKKEHYWGKKALLGFLLLKVYWPIKFASLGRKATLVVMG